jgi:protein-tyrosine phosphatase
VTSREVAWGDLQNAWDLGGLPTASGATRFGRLFRSMSPDILDTDGWADVLAAGIATVVDLRNDYEVTTVLARPEQITVHRRAIEDQDDADFMAAWGTKLGSPAYYPEILRRWPGLVAAAIGAIADAPGPVLFHCGAGRDRTGMIAAMLAELVGVEREAILDDYEGAVRAYCAWLRTHPAREKPMSATELDAHLRTSREELTSFLDALDVERYLLAAGVTTGQLANIRARLLDE